MASLEIEKIITKPYEGQKPGTSGLRKRVKVFQQPHYTENFIQSTLSAIPNNGVIGSTLVVGGDGRFYCTTATQIIIKLAYANKVRKLIIGQNSILSTPAASNIIRKFACTGGILLTASHNPGGPDNDFGIKFNSSNGGPASESVTDEIYKLTTTIDCYYSAVNLPTIDLSKICAYKFGDFEVSIIDPVDDYVTLMKEIYDFESIKEFFKIRKNFKVLVDSMHGVTGPYSKRILVDELGLPISSIMNYVPLEDFGGGHPDPNLTYAHELVERVEKENIDFGAASDGDGDRNMIIGKSCFVNPSDSVAVIASKADAIPYFKKTGIKGLARSMPTSQSIDRVAAKKGYPVYEVPTGWKFFGNLMDADKLSICGEESFGTGSDHIREKDGFWAILAWLQILAITQKTNPAVTLNDILKEHYSIFGRNYFSRYDYEDVDTPGAEKCVALARNYINLVNNTKGVHTLGKYSVKLCDDFKYVDPIDGSISVKQGIRIIFTDESRIIIRLSGTGSQGATIRIYVEKYSMTQVDLNVQDAVSDLIQISLELLKIEENTGRKEPTVIT